MICLSSCSENSATAWQKHHEQGGAALKQGDFSAALSEFEAASNQAKQFAPDDIRLVTSINDLAGAYVESDHPEKSKSLFLKAQDLEAPHQEQSPQWRVETGRTALGLANLYRDLGELALAKPLYEKASVILKGVDNSAQLQKEVEKNTAKMRLAAELANTEYAQPNQPTQSAFDRRNDEMLNVALQLPENIPWEKGESIWRSTLAKAKLNCGVKDKFYRSVLESAWTFCFRKKHYRSARELISADINNYPGVEFVDSNSPDLTAEKVESALSLGKDLQLLSQTVRAQGKFQEAIKPAQRAVAICERCGGKNIDLVERIESLADAYNEAREPDKAYRQYKRALSILSDLQFQQHAVAQILSKLGYLERDQLHNYVAAEDYFNQAIALEKAHPSTAGYLQQLLNVLGALEMMLCKYDQASELFHQSYLLAAQSTGKDKASLIVNSLLSEARAVTCKRGNAETLYQQSIAVAKGSHDCDLVQTSMTSFASYFDGLADFSRSQAVQKELSAYVQHDKTCNSHVHARVYQSMATTDLYKGDLAQAELLYDRAVHAEELQNPPDWSNLSVLLMSRGCTRSYNRQPVLAEQAFSRAAQLCKSKCSQNADLLWSIHLHWCCSSWLSGREDDYALHLKIATELVDKRSQPPATTLANGINTLNKYVRGSGWGCPTNLASAISGSDAMRKLMGADNLYYLATLKQLEIRFAQAGRIKDAQYFRNRAEKERREVLHHQR